jgi:hypothetical protein
MSTIENYIPEEGIMVYSDPFSQRVTSVSNGSFNFRSRRNTDILPENKCVDSCWETGNLYYLRNGAINKVKYNGDSIASLSLSNVVSLAVSQAYLPMARNPYEFREDNGCWLIRNPDNELIKTDNLLSPSSVLKNLSNPGLVVSSDIDNGCYLFDDGMKWVMKINSEGEVLTYITYAAIAASLTSSYNVKRAIVDHVGNLWILIDIYLYKITLSNNSLFKTLTLDSLSFVGYSPYSSTVSDFDIDRTASTAAVYVTGGCRNKAWIIKYNINGAVINASKNIAIEHPVAIKVTQRYNSQGIYIITESDTAYLPLECETSSSSSSSSSSEGYSSTSSSTTSSSSLGEPCCGDWEIHFPNPAQDYVLPVWTINGLTMKNAPNCRIWAEVYYIFTSMSQGIRIYNSAVKSTSNLIADGSWPKNTSGNIPLTQVNASGVSGTVEWWEGSIPPDPDPHPVGINYPNTLFELRCVESSSSSSSHSSSSSSSESSWEYSSFSSSSAAIYDCTDLVCRTPDTGSSNACAIFTNWVINGTTNVNTKQGSLIIQMTNITSSTYQLGLYAADDILSDPSGPPNGPLVAQSDVFTWSSLTPCPVDFTEVSSSGIYGSVIWTGWNPSIIDTSFTLLTCPEYVPSSSSETSVEYCNPLKTWKAVIEDGSYDIIYSFDLDGVHDHNSTECVLWGTHSLSGGYHTISLYKDSGRSHLVAQTDPYIWVPGERHTIYGVGSSGITGDVGTIFGGISPVQLFRLYQI